VDLDRDQSVILALEILHAIEFGHSLEQSSPAVVPSVIGAMKNRSNAAGLRDPLGRVVTTDIVKGTQLTVRVAHSDNRLTRDGGSDELSGLSHLLDSPNNVPGIA